MTKGETYAQKVARLTAKAAANRAAIDALNAKAAERQARAADQATARAKARQIAAGAARTRKAKAKAAAEAKRIADANQAAGVAESRDRTNTNLKRGNTVNTHRRVQVDQSNQPKPRDPKKPRWQR